MKQKKKNENLNEKEILILQKELENKKEEIIKLTKVNAYLRKNF